MGLLCFASFGQNIPNYDLPELLVSNDGSAVNNSEDWKIIRRPEIVELFENSVYGRVPDMKLDISYKLLKIDKNALQGKAIQKEVIATFSNGKESLEMNMLIFLPKNDKKPVPVFLGMNFYGNHTIHSDSNITITSSYVNNNADFSISDNKASDLSRGVRSHRWPIQRILDRGYGVVSIYYGDIDPDFDDDFQNGIHKLFYKDNEQPKANEWGSIAAWAYGLSKAMDYLETDNNIDKDKVAVIGHSRLGKTALWAGAMDQRFAITISNDSGCGGAALSRRKQGETVKKINTSFPHWFCKNFHLYNEKEEDLPVDQHMLIGLIAPRPVYVASASEDLWADPRGEYLSLYHSGEVYSLFGLENFGSDTMPELDQSKTIGNMGYHIRSGKHDLTLFDWEKYMDFADVHFNN
jgi:hypothetical protein